MYVMCMKVQYSVYKYVVCMKVQCVCGVYESTVQCVMYVVCMKVQCVCGVY